MPLLDHAGRSVEVEWYTFHQNWAVKMVDRLNADILSEHYRSESNTHLGNRAEVDVATRERVDTHDPFASANGHGGLAVETMTYAPPAPPLTATVAFADGETHEVKIRRGRWDLIAAVELVSKSNKDRSETRSAFAAKCADYLSAGVSVVVVDIANERLADLHLDLCDLLELPDSLLWKSPTGLSAISYRTVQGALKPGLAVGDGKVRLDVWPHALTVGAELPTVPLWLAADLAVPLELELTYAAACKSLRLG